MSFAMIFLLVPLLCLLFIYVTVSTVYIFISNHMYHHILLYIISFDMKYGMQCDVAHHSKYVKVTSSVIIYFGLFWEKCKHERMQL